MKEHQEASLADSSPLSVRCPQYALIRRMLLGVTSPALALMIGAAEDIEERILNWSEGLEPPCT